MTTEECAGPGTGNSPERSARPLVARRWLASGSLGLAIALVLALFGYLQWANTLPRLGPDPRPVPSPNGYDACLKAALALRGKTNTSALSPIATAEPEQVRRVLLAQLPALDSLRKAMRLPFRFPPITELSAQTGNYGHYSAEFREATRELVAESWLAEHDGRHGEAIERALDAVDLGARMGRSGTLLASLTGSACIVLGSTAAERSIASLKPEEAHQAGQRMETIIAGYPSTADWLETERRRSLLLIQLVAAGKLGYPELETDPPDHDWPLRLRRAWLRLYPKHPVYEAADRYYERAIAESRKPAVLRIPPSAATDWLSQHTVGQPAELGLQDKSLTELRLLRLELALQEYRGAQRHFPQSLAELNGVSSQNRLDPYDGQSLRYRRAGASYLLYSVGPDGKDDGGTPIRAFRAWRSAGGDLCAPQSLR